VHRSMLTAMLAASFLFAPGADAQLRDLLDRAKRETREAATDARDLRRDVERAVDVEGQVDDEVGRARAEAERAVPTEEKTEVRAAAEIERTEAMQAVRTLERDATEIASADERAAGEVRGEIARTERDIERQTDLEGRARTAAADTDAGIALRDAERERRDAEREVRAVSTTDERAAAEIEREARAIPNDAREIERNVRAIGRAFE